MSTEEKRELMMRVVEPVVRALCPSEVERWMGLLRNGTDKYIEDAYERFFTRCGKEQEDAGGDAPTAGA